jgi:hypothetical protein
MSNLVEPIIPMSPKTWFARLFAHTSISSSHSQQIRVYEDLQTQKSGTHLTQLPSLTQQLKAYLPHLLKKLFVETYEFDGLDLPTGHFTTAEGIEGSYDADSLPLPVVISTFLGLPNRSEHSNHGAPDLGLWQVWKNLWGGWDSKNSDHIFTRKMILQRIAVPLLIKPLIFLIKLIEIIPKIVLNVVKLGTEFLPAFIMNATGAFLGLSTANLAWTLRDDSLSVPEKTGGIIIFGLAVILTAPIHYAARLLTLIGTAITSPLKSAKMTWAFGYAFHIEGYPIPSRILGAFFGGLGLTVSIALTATLWAITLPLVFTAATTLFPALGTALNSLVAYPVVASSLTAINTAIASTWSFLGLSAVFAYASTALATYLGIHITAAALAVGVTVGLIAAPVATVAAGITTGLSNAWARWTAMSFSKAFFPWLSAKAKSHSHQKDAIDMPLLKKEETTDGALIESDHALNLKQLRDKQYIASDADERQALLLFFKAQGTDYTPPADETSSQIQASTGTPQPSWK